VLLIKFSCGLKICALKPHHRKAARRYMKCLADRFQLKIREGKTKRKKPPHY